jgi:hypothetical protein
MMWKRRKVVERNAMRNAREMCVHTDSKYVRVLDHEVSTEEGSSSRDDLLSSLVLGVEKESIVLAKVRNATAQALDLV